MEEEDVLERKRREELEAKADAMDARRSGRNRGQQGKRALFRASSKPAFDLGMEMKTDLKKKLLT